MAVPTKEGIIPRTITTARISTRVLFSGAEDGIPVLFLHGNTSSATFWEETMLTLPAGFRGIAPDQRGFGDADPSKKIDAARGVLDLAEDAIAFLDTLGLAKVHLVGHSMGGMVVWALLLHHADRLRSVTQVAPGSPYGFGGTKDVEGTPCYPDFAGSGGGLSNPELIHRMQEGDRSLDSQFSPRMALRALIFKPPFVPTWEEELLSSMLSTHLGPEDVPGDKTASPNWPFVAPGKWGPANALSPKYQPDIRRLYDIQSKPPVLWVRGANDLIVSDTAASDPGFLGMAGFIPGWPGKEIYPPQPMLSQTRLVLNRYAAAGGSIQEVIIPDCGHTPYVEKPAEFNAVFHKFLCGN